MAFNRFRQVWRCDAKISASLEMPWPCLDDRLVRKAIDWGHAITFPDNPPQRHVLISIGYFRAAHALVDHCSTNMYEEQTMIYPILFCYRHALEMAMKGIGSYAPFRHFVTRTRPQPLAALADL